MRGSMVMLKKCIINFNEKQNRVVCRSDDLFIYLLVLVMSMGGIVGFGGLKFGFLGLLEWNFLKKLMCYKCYL